MQIEHIAGGRYILNLSDKEERELKTIAIGFYRSNRSVCLRKMIEAGIAVYNDLLEQGYEQDDQFKESLKVVSDILVGDSVEYELKPIRDIPKESEEQQCT